MSVLPARARVARTSSLLQRRVCSAWHNRPRALPSHQQVRSLYRVMTLMGHTVDASTGFVYLDRGYSTETLANETLDVSRRACA